MFKIISSFVLFFNQNLNIVINDYLTFKDF